MTDTKKSTANKTDSSHKPSTGQGSHAKASHEEETGDSFKTGDKVSWASSQGTVQGTVEKKLTQPIDIKAHHVAASPDNPEYLVKSDKTGAEAAHKPAELHQAK